jgi:mRNA-degrading endonuclease toxin of MazEF toxin-antitoxin module
VKFLSGEGGLDRDCVAKTDQVTVIDKLQIDVSRGPLGAFDGPQMARLEVGLRWSLELDA